MLSVEENLERLSRSRFRSSFYLTKAEKSYYLEKGEERIASHAADFVLARLSPAVIPNDGRQTPMHGHPVFKAQHACACCCRGCLEKWYGIPKGTELSVEQQKYIVELLMAWIKKQMATV
jgi:exodeoxyribonuclease V alpha subunit